MRFCYFLQQETNIRFLKLKILSPGGENRIFSNKQYQNVEIPVFLQTMNNY
jgi:hypothetical protein